MIKIMDLYRQMHREPRFYASVALGVVLLGTSLFANYGANIYTSHQTVNVAQDLLLDHLPVINLGYLYLEGFLLLIGFVIFLAFYRPNRLPFLLKTIAVFILIRSCSMMLTHLTVPLPEDAIAIYAPNGSFVASFSSGNDLFFSLHTGFPFLLALAFWKEKVLRWIFLGLSGIFGFAVLLAHVHYSIDVFSAFFITYAIYHLSAWLFLKDHTLFHASAGR